MYSLSIHFGPSPVPAQFLFKDREKANACMQLALTCLGDENKISDNVFIAITDDFGQTAVIKEVHGMVLEDMDLGEESRIQRGLSQARGQAKANERARTDPVLLKAMTQQAGPSMITPFGRNGFNG